MTELTDLVAALASESLDSGEPPAVLADRVDDTDLDADDRARLMRPGRVKVTRTDPPPTRGERCSVADWYRSQGVRVEPGRAARHRRHGVTATPISRLARLVSLTKLTGGAGPAEAVVRVLWVSWDADPCVAER
jgi:hypothetical protein